MKRAGRWVVVTLVVAAGLSPCLARGGTWPGVDQAVVEKFATAAGRSPQAPLIDLGGDLLLFAFLVAGAVGGFVAGYYFRELFPRKGKPDDTSR